MYKRNKNSTLDTAKLSNQQKKMVFWQRIMLLSKRLFAQSVFQALLYPVFCGLGIILICLVALIEYPIHVTAQTPTPIIAPTTASKATTKPPNAQTRCKINAYIMRLNDFNFTQSSFFIDTWLYANCNKPNALDFKTVYFPNGKNYKMTYTSTTQMGAGTYVIGNLQGTFEQNWDLKNYPFDRHKLQLFFEPSENINVDNLVYESDMKSSKIHPDINLEDGWKITSFNVKPESSHYISNFGDPRIKTDEFYFPKLIITFDLQRISYMSFLKLTAGVYIIFAVCLLCIFFDVSQNDLFTASLSLLVGCLFAVFVNLQVAESMLGQVEEVTLVDKIHIATMLFILFVSAIQTFFHRLYNGEKKKNLLQIEHLSLGATLTAYVFMNIFFITSALLTG
ncbi:hypothetical protein F7734_25815 [Scytonema sp. UIC 10036]|uniref:hypothetical protein n=1 Tax=Scytonema sp. UIC 10036 TaxID=2304196 RepID=UPI0012DA4721|nr:hypothetical protein [Scytonema sp. UIC 10036]MUG95589.1 hypothetical protein [Scytonema sp. UIC 10036]